MGRPIRYSTSTPTGSFKKGNMDIGISSNIDFGPTSTTGFYPGIEPSTGGYTIYENKASQGPSIYVAANDSELIDITKNISGTTYANAQECLQYFASEDDKIVVSSEDIYPNIETGNLRLHVDARNVSSYPNTGSALYDLSNSNSGSLGTLFNGTFVSGSGFYFDGSDDFIRMMATPLNTGSEQFSIEAVFWSETSNRNGSVWEQGRRVGQYSYGSKASLWVRNNGVIGMIGVNSDYNSPGGVYSANEWSHIVITVDDSLSSSKVKVYKKGDFRSSGNMSGINNLNIQCDFSGLGSEKGGYSFFKGKIASVNVYDKVLTPEEIKRNYFQAPIVTDDLELSLDAGNLLSYEETFTTAYSLTGSLSGSLINGTGFNRNNGGSWDFDGTNDYITLGSPSELAGVQVPLTICVWAKADSFDSYNVLWAADKDTSGTGGLYSMLRIDSGVLRYFTTTANGGYQRNQSNPPFSPSTGVWNFYTVVVSGSLASPTVTFYLNEESVSYSYAAMSSSPDLTVDIRIGGNQRTSTEYWNGDIGMVSWYNRALTANEVAQNFEAHRKRFGL